MLEIKDVSINYGHVSAVTEVSLLAANQEIVALLGCNSSGKSTLMRAIMGLVKLTSGAVIFDNKRIDTLSVDDRVKLGMVLVPEGRGILPNMTVIENLQMGGYILTNSNEVKCQIERVMTFFPALKTRLSQMGGTLSGGEQQMLAIGRALMSKPKLILMDEPSMGLAPIVIEHVFSIIKDINSDGTVIFLVEQNARMALSVAHKFYVIQKGKLVLEGRTMGDKLIVETEGNVRVTLSEEDFEKAYLGG